MATLDIQNNAPNGIVIRDTVFDDNTLNATGALTYLKGTLLGRITSSGKLTAYLTGGILGEDVPIGVLLEEEVFTGAGDRPVRAIVSGVLRRAGLVAHGVGAITVPESDLLRQTGIISLTTQQLADLDNS